MFCRGIEQNDTPVMRIVGHLHVASDRFPSEWSATRQLWLSAVGAHRYREIAIP